MMVGVFACWFEKGIKAVNPGLRVFYALIRLGNILLWGEIKK
jgi:hypothetical protein